MKNQQGSVAREELEEYIEEQMETMEFTPEELKIALEEEMVRRWVLARREEKA